MLPTTKAHFHDAKCRSERAKCGVIGTLPLLEGLGKVDRPLQPHRPIEYYRLQNPLLDEAAVQSLAKKVWRESFLEAADLGWACKDGDGQDSNGKSSSDSTRHSKEWWESKHAHFIGLGFPHSLDLWKDGSMRKTEFVACMEFIASLAAAENMERVTSLLRGARIGLWDRQHQQQQQQQQRSKGWQTSLLDGLRLGDTIHFMEARQHLCIARAVEMLPIGQRDGYRLRGSTIKSALLPLAKQRFHGWDDGKWDHLARNMSRFQTLWRVLRMETTDNEVGYGLALLLPANEWNWTVKGKVTRVSKEAWSWFVTLVPTISPNLVRMVTVLAPFGTALVQDVPAEMPPLLRMKVERQRSINLISTNGIGLAVGDVTGLTELSIISRYEKQRTKPWSWADTVRMAGGV